MPIKIALRFVHLPRRIRGCDEHRAAIYWYHSKRNGDVRVERVYEHSALSLKIPKHWRGPFQSVGAASLAATEEA